VEESTERLGLDQERLGGRHLSDQGKATLRNYVNRVATKAGYIYPYEEKQLGWRITPEGREFISEPMSPTEEVINVDTQQPEQISNTAKGAAFERYILDLLKKMHPYYTWYYQGRHKHNERGLDFIGDRIGQSMDEFKVVGVQAKFHSTNSVPSETEWLKFLAGCFARRVEGSIFITSGRLTSEQRREAGEARVTVIEGREEISRIAQLFGYESFELFDEPSE